MVHNGVIVGSTLGSRGLALFQSMDHDVVTNPKRPRAHPLDRLRRALEGHKAFTETVHVLPCLGSGSENPGSKVTPVLLTLFGDCLDSGPLGAGALELAPDPCPDLTECGCRRVSVMASHSWATRANGPKRSFSHILSTRV